MEIYYRLDITPTIEQIIGLYENSGYPSPINRTMGR